MLNMLRLPIDIDIAGLQHDVDRLTDDDWIPHFNTRDYEGDWSAASLRAIGGDARRIYPDPSRTDYSDTDLRRRCPATSKLLEAMDCRFLAVRFMRLGPGSRILEHRDLRLSYEDEELRLHIPISSGPDVRFTVDGTVVPLKPGECWYLNLTRMHAVTNRTDRPRVHLVADCEVDDRMRQWMCEAIAIEQMVGT